MRPFLTFLSLFTLLFFLAPVLCLSFGPQEVQPDPIIQLPQQIPYQGSSVSAADLILGAVGAMNVRGYQPEALKAVAVVCTTNLVKHYAETGTGDGLEIMTPQQAKEAWGDYWFSQYWPQMQQAVAAVWGEILIKNSAPYPEAHTFPLSWGRTEGGVECPFDETSNFYFREITVPLEEFTEIFPDYGASFSVKNAQNGRVETVASGNRVLTGIEMMDRFGLPSPAFTVTITASAATFRCRGRGTGVGMSLYGANERAKEGQNYKEILSDFYPDATLQEANRSLGSR